MSDEPTISASAVRRQLGAIGADMEQMQQRIDRLEWMREALSRAECRRQGIDPDDIIADGGHLAWHLVGYEAACKEIPDPQLKLPGR
ncbi:MAG TPA: hypothetical protein VIO57_10120 [Chloroflexota bacterium]|jgi:hypothetical protein